MDDLDKRLGNLSYADTGEKQMAAVGKMGETASERLGPEMGEQGRKIAGEVEEIHEEEFGRFKEKVDSSLKSLYALGMTDEQVRATLLEIVSILERKKRDAVLPPSDMQHLIDGIEEEIRGQKRKQQQESGAQKKVGPLTDRIRRARN